MKTIGIIGGIGPESTIGYYRSLIALHREQRPEAGSPPIIVNSIDLKRVLSLMTANRLSDLVDHFQGEIQRLAAAGADFALLAANTPHIVFDDLVQVSPIPLVSIVEATREEARSRGLRRVGLLGTRFTMQASFYPDVFSKSHIEVSMPNEEEQAYVHEKYFSELVDGVFLDETRERLTTIVRDMAHRDGVQAVILGGTELPLILRGGEVAGIPLLDTTQIHVRAALKEAQN